MIQTFYQIGNAIKDDPKYSRYFQPWGNPFPGRENEAKVLVAEVENKEFKRVSIEDFRVEYIKKYLYKIGSTKGRATNTVPTVPFIDLKKSFGKIEQSFLNFKHSFISKTELAKIKSNLSEFDLDAKTSYLFTFKIDGKYLGEKNEMVELFKENACRGFYEKNYSGIKNSSSKNYCCAVSGEKGMVYGFVDSLGFTVNDDAYMRNGFDQSNSYKMFPVSPKAAEVISGVRSLVFTSKFSNRFSGNIKYLILPKMLDNRSIDLVTEIFNLFKDKQALNIYSNSEEIGTSGFINKTEKLLNEIIEDEKLKSNDILYDILFYEDKQAQLSLLLQLTDVRPSRLGKIIATKRVAEQLYSSITNFNDGKKTYTFSINLAVIKNYLITEQGKNKVPHPYFFKITEAIFYGNKVNKQVFIGFLLNRFRKAFKELHEKPYGLQTSVKEGFVILQFLEQLNIFHNFNKTNNMEHNEKQVKLDAIGFIEQHTEFFNSNYKKGAFLFGCIVTRLMYNQPGNAFLKELNDLNLDKFFLEKKFPKLISKLRQYGHEFKELEQEAAKYLTSQEKISKDEISFAVTLGIILQKEFDIKNKKIKEVETNLGIKHEIID